MRNMELQKELDALKDAPFAKRTDAQLLAAERVSEANRSRVVSSETKLKQRNSMLGRKHTVESRKKMSATNSGRKISSETRKKISDAKKNISAETRKKMREAKLGKLRNSEIGKKISQSNIGKKRTKESVDKMGKLSFFIARKIRVEYAKWIEKHGINGSKLYFAKKFQVTEKTIYLIVNNKIWVE